MWKLSINALKIKLKNFPHMYEPIFISINLPVKIDSFQTPLRYVVSAEKEISVKNPKLTATFVSYLLAFSTPVRQCMVELMIFAHQNFLNIMCLLKARDLVQYTLAVIKSVIKSDIMNSRGAWVTIAKKI